LRDVPNARIILDQGVYGDSSKTPQNSLVVNSPFTFFASFVVAKPESFSGVDNTILVFDAYILNLVPAYIYTNLNCPVLFQQIRQL
jgi:hypothetical protein